MCQLIVSMTDKTDEYFGKSPKLWYVACSEHGLASGLFINLMLTKFSDASVMYLHGNDPHGWSITSTTATAFKRRKAHRKQRNIVNLSHIDELI